MPSPISSSYNQDGSIKNLSTNDIIWQGQDLECIGLCKGDLLTTTMEKVAVRICNFIEEFDLTDFDFKCLIDSCDSCPEPERKVISVIKLLRDLYCELKERLDNLNPSSQDSCSCFLDVNLKCLATVDGAGEILNNKTEKAIIQTVIDRVCIHDSDIALLKNKTDNLQEQIDAIEINPTAILPGVTSACSFSGSRPLDQAYASLDQAFCNFKELIGTSTEINQAIAQLGQIPELQSNPGFFAIINTLARLINNLVLGYMNLRGRVGAIENSCCAPSCDKIRIGFIPEFDFDNRLLDMRFTAGAGTSIPLGFEDIGSTISITDKNGVSINIVTSGDNIIGNDSTINDVNISGLAYGTLKVKISTKFALKDSNGSVVLSCSDCLSQDIQYSGGCCDIKNEGSESVTILYTTC